jgi:hypothetical protein
LFAKEVIIHSLKTRGLNNPNIEQEIYMVRKDRSDMKVDTFEKKHGIPTGTVRNENGRDTRDDKKIVTIRKEKNK